MRTGSVTHAGVHRCDHPKPSSEQSALPPSEFVHWKWRCPVCGMRWTGWTLVNAPDGYTGTAGESEGKPSFKTRLFQRRERQRLARLIQWDDDA